MLTCIQLATPLPAVGAGHGPAESQQSDRKAQQETSQDSIDTDPELTGGGLKVIGLSPQTPSWFLERMRRLLHDNRAEDAYSLGLEALAKFPQSAKLKLGAAFAAQAAGRCNLTDSHLRQLDGDSLDAGLRRRADYLRAACHGPWRRHLRIDAIIGYRPSLLDRARNPMVRLERGSALYNLCLRLRGLCDPDRPFKPKTQQEGGIDLWYGLSLVNRYRAGTNWDFDAETILFRRRPFRPGFDGKAAMLRLTAVRRNSAAQQVSVIAETGVSQFHLGPGAVAIAQRHFRARLGLTVTHSASRRSHFGLARLTARSRWLNLAQDRLTYHHEFRAGASVMPWLGVGIERTRQSGSGLWPDGRAREGSLGLSVKGRLGTIHLRRLHRSERFRRPLPFLATPHRATTRLTALNLVPAIGGKNSNLKVVLSFEHRKISSLDPFRPRSSKTLILRLSYDAFKT